MANFIEALKVIFLGMVEGITEWLPISSTGHMLLVDQFLQLNESQDFKDMFFVVIQLGAIMAVVLLFWNKMWPFQRGVNKKIEVRKDVFSIWFKVVVACVPGAVITLLFDDYIEAHFQTPEIIAAALILYGIAFILIEIFNKKRIPKIETIDDITYLTAFLIGMFQVLSIIPGTSRSGSTIIGALLIGVSRVAAAEFTFFLAVPVMFGLSAIKIIKFGFGFTALELCITLLGMLVAFVVSLIVVKFLMNYIRKHDFKAFGWYRIILGIVILIYFYLIA
ncbi:MAG: undecaprenyl-diphosphate phosphatase [Clostridia bacterium]|nr:undecaprenyl-diphosphate phosphatase [Clostridia bacterium]